MADDSIVDVPGISEGESSNNSSSSSKPCIFKVPGILRRHSPKSFTPNSFSFGPLHHKKKHLKKTEGIKRQYLDKLLSRKRTDETTLLEDFKRSIPEVEGRARKCYAFPTDHLNKDEFVQMLILDGCFIIELLRKNKIYTKKNDKDNHDDKNNSNINNNNSSNNNNNSSSSNNNNSSSNNNNNSSSSSNNNNSNNSSSNNNNSNNTIDEDDPVFSVSWVLQVLYHDLILLENQIPWFVLDCLFNMTKSPTISGRDDKLLINLALHFIRPNFSEWKLPEIKNESPKGNHILDHLRNALVSSNETVQEPKSDHWQLIPTVTSLRKLGIRFKKVKSSKLLDIKFVKHGVLEIPSLTIQATTCEMLRNLISYEQCYPNCEPKITSYAMLLNSLISTTKDIEVLHEAGIVVNYLNPNDTLEFFNNIYTDTYVKTFSYITICQNVKQYTGRWIPSKGSICAQSFCRSMGNCITNCCGYCCEPRHLADLVFRATVFKRFFTFTSVLKTLRYTNSR